MSAVGLESIDHTVQLTHIWINDLDARLGCHRADFVARIDSAFKTDPLLFTADGITAVFELLSEKVAAGEIEKVRHALPADIRALWPHSSQAAWTATAEGD